jgi:hypothetical protein
MYACVCIVRVFLYVSFALQVRIAREVASGQVCALKILKKRTIIQHGQAAHMFAAAARSRFTFESVYLS